MIRNIAFIGTTGVGKSSSANTLCGSSENPFLVSGGMKSHTKEISYRTSERYKLRLLDTPGFNDNTTDPKEIDKILTKLTDIIVNSTEDNCTPHIDAFVLPQQVSSRLNTLGSDIDHILMLYGREALKSLVILIICTDPENIVTKEEFLAQFEDMILIKRKLEKAKGNSNTEDWFVMWDNKVPLPGQTEQLLDKISKVESYSHKKFVEAKLDREKKERERIEEITRQKDEENKVELERALKEKEEEYADMLKQAEMKHEKEIQEEKKNMERELNKKKQTDDSQEKSDTLRQVLDVVKYGLDTINNRFDFDPKVGESALLSARRISPVRDLARSILKASNSINVTSNPSRATRTPSGLALFDFKKANI